MRFLRPLFLAAMAVGFLTSTLYAKELNEVEIQEVIERFNLEPEKFNLLMKQETSKGGEYSLYFSPEAENVIIKRQVSADGEETKSIAYILGEDKTWIQANPDNEEEAGSTYIEINELPLHEMKCCPKVGRGPTGARGPTGGDR